MSLICKDKNNPTVEELLNQNLNRDLGLSNVYNVNADLTVCNEVFVSPTYYMTGATKPVTGLTVTSDGVHNISEIDDFDLTFFFTGSTQYTGYTGEFCYTLSGERPFTERCFAYSGLTGTTLTDTVSITDLSPFDTEYRVLSWDVFESLECNVGLRIDTSDYPLLNDEIADMSWYLVTITNPVTPILIDSLTVPPLSEGATFINTLVETPINGANQTLIQPTPIGNVAVISVNGVTMHKDDYAINGNLLTFGSGVTFEALDVIQAYYHTANSEIQSQQAALSANYHLEMMAFTGATTGITSTYENIINWNTTNARFEMFLTENINTGVQPTVTVNGVNVAFDIDVFKSNVVENKLIFGENVNFEIDDIISVYYINDGVQNQGELGRMRTDSPELPWVVVADSLNTTNSSGIFFVEVAERGDDDFTTIITSGSTLYIPENSGYSLEVGPITTDTIKYYIYRVRFEKTYTTLIADNTYVTSSTSNNGSFWIDWNYVNNTNF